MVLLASSNLDDTIYDGNKAAVLKALLADQSETNSVWNKNQQRNHKPKTGPSFVIY